MILKKQRKFQTNDNINDWILYKELAGRRIDEAADALNSGGSTGGECAPEAILYRVSGSTIIDAQNDTIGNIDSDGIITSSDLDMECPLFLVSDATVSSGSLWDIPTDADYIMDVWFDYLHATRDEHWLFEGPRSINVLSPIDPDTIVRAAFVTPPLDENS